MKRTLATLLFGLLLLLHSNSNPNNPPTRTLNVKLFIEISDTTQNNHHNPPEKIKKQRINNIVNTINNISKQMQKEFSITLNITDIIPHTFEFQQKKPDQNSLESQFNYFYTHTPKKNADIILGVTTQTPNHGNNTKPGIPQGIAHYQKGVILVRYHQNPTLFKKLILHEIYHLFGATHVNNPHSLMDRYLKGNTIDPTNHTLISYHRNRNFNGTSFPLEKKYLPKAAKLYHLIAQTNENTTPAKTDGKSDGKSEGKRRLEDVYVSLALVYTEMGQYAEAATQYQKALEINPHRPRVHYNLGKLYLEKNQPARAYQYYQKAVDLKPGFGMAYAGMGDACLSENKFNEAQKAFQNAMTYGYRDANLLANLSFIAIHQDNFTDAIRHARNALQINPQLAIAHYNLALALYKSKRFPEAFERVKKAEKYGLTINEELKKALIQALSAKY